MFTDHKKTIQTRVSETPEGRKTKKLSQEISRTESRILGALSRLDDFLLNRVIQRHSGTKSNLWNKTTPKVGPDDGYHMVIGVPEELEITCCFPSRLQANRKKPHCESTAIALSKHYYDDRSIPNYMNPQPLANNTTTSNFHNSLHRFSKLPNSLTTTMPTFDRKTE